MIKCKERGCRGVCLMQRADEESVCIGVQGVLLSLSN